MTQPLLQAADLRGAARLTTDAVAGLTHMVEAMHARIASIPQRPDRTAPEPDDRTHGLTGLVYETVRGVTRVAGGTAEALLGWLGPALASSPDPRLTVGLRAELRIGRQVIDVVAEAIQDVRPPRRFGRKKIAAHAVLLRQI